MSKGGEYEPNDSRNVTGTASTPDGRWTNTAGNPPLADGQFPEPRLDRDDYELEDDDDGESEKWDREDDDEAGDEDEESDDEDGDDEDDEAEEDALVAFEPDAELLQRLKRAEDSRRLEDQTRH